MLLLFGAVCSVSLVLAQFGRTHVWAGGKGMSSTTLPYERRAPMWIKLKPEDLSEQFLQVGEEGYDALVHWCHFEGQFRCGTGKDVHYHQVPAYPQEGGPCSVHPCGSELLREESQVHPEAPRQEPQGQRFEVPSHPRWEPHSPSCAGTTDASSPCLPTGRTSLRRPRLGLVAPLSVMNVSISLSGPKRFSCDGSCARAFEECDPNVSVRRIEASFRKGR